MRRKKKRKIIRTLFRFAVFCGVFFVLGVVGIFAYFAKDLPDPSKMEERRVVESTKIYDRTGEVILYDIHGEEKRTVIPFEEIPQFVKDATVAIEDDNFYHHFGVDWKGILRAAWANLNKNKISQGGSTITQQFIKNAYLGGPMAERTYPRKIKEVVLAVELESKYTKDEILGFYLNQVPYGSNAYGVESASQTFLNKSARDITLAEAAILAALTQAPSYYSPYGSHPEELKNRQEYVLDRMVKFNYITEEQAKIAKEEKIEYVGRLDLKAHHFVAMVEEYLEEKYSGTYADINKAGLKVHTTLDWDLQQLAEEVVNEGALENEKKYNADNAALVALDPKTGQVLALVGSKNYAEDQFNVATSPYRQPGSSFKPFAYAAAFQKGFNPESILFDLPTSFGKFGPGEGTEYAPNNYDLKFRGPLTMRQALAQSINLPAVKTLYLAGVSETINLAQDMGITTLKDRKQYGLSLVLGGGEVKLIDETAAYGVFAAEGVRHQTNFILKIEDAEGNILEEYQDKATNVLERQIALQITDILSDEAARAPMFGAKSNLYTADLPTAAKTGTTQDYTDGWTIGYTPSLVVGVWAGNNDFTEKMKKGAAGLYVAAPIWNEFITKAHETQNIEVENFTAPEPIASSTIPMLNGEIAYNNKVKIDKISRKLATDLTPPDLIEEHIYQEVHCVLYYTDKSAEDPQFQNWEGPVLEWARNQPCAKGVCYNQNPPTQSDDIHTIENQPKIKITSPEQNDLISQSVLTIQAEAEASLGIKQTDFFFNNQLIGSDTIKPYSVNFNILPYLTNSSTQTIKVRAYDTVLNRQEDEIEIRTVW